MSEINKDLPFDREAEENDRDYVTEEGGGNENVIEWIRPSKRVTAQFSAHSKLYNRILKYASEYPEEVEIAAMNADGSIVVHFPLSYVKITRPVERVMSDEEKAAAAERLRRGREKNTRSENV